MDSKTDARKQVLRDRHDVTRNHWCWSGVEWLSAEEASDDPHFYRSRIVDWEKLIEVFGNDTAFWAYSRREFQITQEERIQYKINAERALNYEAPENEADWD